MAPFVTEQVGDLYLVALEQHNVSRHNHRKSH
jgi:hypothetical protein